MTMMIAVVRIRGSVGTRTDVEDALIQMGLKEQHSCVVVPQIPSYLGVLRKVKDYVTWGVVGEDVAKKLLVAKKLKHSDDKTNPYKGLVFHLAPPRKGFKNSIKTPYPRGELGDRKNTIGELIERMI